MRIQRSIALLTVFLGLCTVSACSSKIGQTAQENLLDKAAQEATAIVQQAQATALLLQAQMKATAMVNAVNDSQSKPAPTATYHIYVAPTDPPKTADQEVGEGSQITLSPENEQTIEVVSVGIAGEGGFIMVRFKAPPKVAERWWQGAVSVEDETNGEVYNEIPVMPRIGPLIGRPKREGQLGYVMLVNRYPGLQIGNMVTVTLGEYRFEHIPVQ